MIKSLNLPRELIYMGKGENGYEKYMAETLLASTTCWMSCMVSSSMKLLLS